MLETEFLVLNNTMRNGMKKSVLISAITGMLVALLLVGCGRDAALDEYKKNMEQYFANIAALDEYMNAINPETDLDGRQILGYLDQLETLTIEMADFAVPEQFEIVESLADEAAENMTSAVELYHQFYEDEEPNINISDAAYQYYVRANKRIVYVRSILQGNMPEELVVVEDDGTSSDGIPQVDDNAIPSQESINSGSDEEYSPDDFDTDDTVFYEGDE